MRPVTLIQSSEQVKSFENHLVSQDSLVLLFSNHGSPRLYPFQKVGGNGGRGQFKKAKTLVDNQTLLTVICLPKFSSQTKFSRLLVTETNWEEAPCVDSIYELLEKVKKNFVLTQALFLPIRNHSSKRTFKK